MHDLRNRVFLTATGIEHLPNDILEWSLTDRQECGHRVEHERKITGRLERTEFDFGLSSRELCDDGWNHSPSRLAWAEGVERAQGHGRRVETGVKTCGQLIGSDLGCRIG